MKATEIVEKLKAVLLGAEQEVEETVQEEVQEEVQLTEEATEETVEAQEESTEEVELNEEVPAVEETPEELDRDIYATKEELAEVKAMVEKMMGIMDSKEEKMEVPKEKLSAVEEEVEPMVHTPENESEREFVNLAPNAPKTTMSRVLDMINR